MRGEIIKIKLRSFKSSEHVKEKGVGSYRGCGYLSLFSGRNAPVICIPGSPGAGDSGNIAGLKCLALTSDVSRQCRGYDFPPIHCHINLNLILMIFLIFNYLYGTYLISKCT